MIEASLIEKRAVLTTATEKAQNLSLPSMPDLFTAFIRALRGEGPMPLSRAEAFRITEIALKGSAGRRNRPHPFPPVHCLRRGKAETLMHRTLKHYYGLLYGLL